jgi:hypothetical protein
MFIRNGIQTALEHVAVSAMIHQMNRRGWPAGADDPGSVRRGPAAPPPGD